MVCSSSRRKSVNATERADTTPQTAPRTQRLFLGARGVAPTVVMATMRANTVVRNRRAALRASRQIQGLDRVVTATFAGAGPRRAPFGNCHDLSAKNFKVGTAHGLDTFFQTRPPQRAGHGIGASSALQATGQTVAKPANSPATRMAAAAEKPASLACSPPDAGRYRRAAAVSHCTEKFSVVTAVFLPS